MEENEMSEYKRQIADVDSEVGLILMGLNDMIDPNEWWAWAQTPTPEYWEEAVKPPSGVCKKEGAWGWILWDLWKDTVNIGPIAVRVRIDCGLLPY